MVTRDQTADWSAAIKLILTSSNCSQRCMIHIDQLAIVIIGQLARRPYSHISYNIIDHFCPSVHQQRPQRQTEHIGCSLYTHSFQYSAKAWLCRKANIFLQIVYHSVVSYRSIYKIALVDSECGMLVTSMQCGSPVPGWSIVANKLYICVPVYAYLWHFTRDSTQCLARTSYRNSVCPSVRPSVCPGVTSRYRIKPR